MSMFELHEVDSIYVGPRDRFVVSLIVGYDEEDLDPSEGPATAQAAAHWALELTRDGGQKSTRWYVYDRLTGVMHEFEQREIEEIE